MKTSKIQCGYRSNDIYTGEDYLIHDIIEYETDELQNTDILDYSEDQHGVTTHQELLEALSSHFKQPVDTLSINAKNTPYFNVGMNWFLLVLPYGFVSP